MRQVQLFRDTPVPGEALLSFMENGIRTNVQLRAPDLIADPDAGFDPSNDNHVVTKGLQQFSGQSVEQQIHDGKIVDVLVNNPIIAFTVARIEKQEILPVEAVQDEPVFTATLTTK